MKKMDCNMNPLFLVFFICCSHFSLAFHSGGSFGDNGLYKVVIGKTRADQLADPVEEKKETVIMHNRKGLAFRCVLPDVYIPPDDNGKLADLNTETIEKTLVPPDSHRGGCVQLVTSGWWHYEFCYNKHVLQYHMEGGVRVSPTISLGQYSHAFEWSNVTKKDALHKKERFHTQFYVNGSDCDITGRKRESHVKFFCDNKNWAHDYIQSVHEPQSCVYEVIIFSRRLCKIAYFMEEEPVVGQIVCNPLVVPKKERKEKSVKDSSALDLGLNLMESLLKGSTGLLAETDGDDYFDDIEGEDLDNLQDSIDEQIFLDPFRDRRSQTPMETAKRDEDDFVAENNARNEWLDKAEPLKEELQKAIDHVSSRNLGTLSKQEKKVFDQILHSVKDVRDIFDEKIVDVEEVERNLNEITDGFKADGISEKFRKAFANIVALLRDLMEQHRHYLDLRYVPPTATAALPEKSILDQLREKMEKHQPIMAGTDWREAIHDTKRVSMIIKHVNLPGLKPFSDEERKLFDKLVDTGETTTLIVEAFEDGDDEEQEAIIKGAIKQLKTIFDSLESPQYKDIRQAFKNKMQQILLLKMASLEELLIDDTDANVAVPNKPKDTPDITGVGKLQPIDHTTPRFNVKNPGLANRDPEVDSRDTDILLQGLGVDELTPDEKEVAEAMVHGFAETNFVGVSGNDQNSEKQIADLKRSRLMVENARKALLDPAKIIRKDFRQKMLPRLETISELLDQFEKTDTAIRGMKHANAQLKAKDVDLDSWIDQFGGTINKARAVDAENRARAARRQKARQGADLVDTKNKLPEKPIAKYVPHPTPLKSKARTFWDVIAEMNPAYRQMREIERLIVERLLPLGHAGPIQVQMIGHNGNAGGNGGGGLNSDQLEIIKQNLAAIFAGQITSPFQQQKGITELEQNYNLEEEDEEQQENDADLSREQIMQRMLGVDG